MATGGTDNHLALWDLRPQALTGSKMETLCDKVGITLNKNSVYGDRSATSPGGVRVGTVCHCKMIGCLPCVRAPLIVTVVVKKAVAYAPLDNASLRGRVVSQGTWCGGLAREPSLQVCLRCTCLLSFVCSPP